MTPEQPDDTMQRLWRAQQAEGGDMSIQEIRKRAAAFQRRWQAANLIEYAAAAWVVGMSLWVASRAERPLVAIGMTLIAAAAVFIAGYMHRHGWTRRPRQEEAAALDFYREELGRRRDLLRGIWKWYLLPLAPGFLLLLAARVRETPLEAMATLAGALVLSAGIIWLNARAANRLQRELDAL